MLVPKEQVEFKKVVGKLKGKSVWYTKLKGGLHIISNESGQSLAMGPMKAVALHLAQKYEPDLELTELSKSSWVDPVNFAHLLPEWEENSLRIRKMGGL